MGRDLLLLLRSKLRQTYNGWTRGSEKGAWRRRLAPLIALLWLFLLGSTAHSGFRFLQQNLGVAAQDVAYEAISGVFLGTLTLVLVNGMRQVFDTFFLAGDLPLLLSTPLSRRAIFSDRFVESLLDNGIYALVMVLPPGVAFLYAFAAPWLAYLWLVLAFLLLLAGLTALSILLDLLAVRWLPASRARQALMSLNLILFLLVLIAYNAVSSEIVQTERVVSFLSAGHISSQAYLPTVWVAQSLVALVPGFDGSFWTPAALLLGTCGGLTFLAVWAAGQLYSRGWGAVQEAPRRRAQRAPRTTASTGRVSPLGAFLRKDLYYFVRESRSWATLLFGLVVLGFFSVSFARDWDGSSTTLAVTAALLVPGMAGLFTTRWSLSAFAQEAQAWWVIQSSPLRESDLFHAKFFLQWGLVMAYTTVAAALIAVLAPLPWFWLPLTALLAVVLSAGMAAAGLAVAAWRTDMSRPLYQQQRDVVGSYTLMALLTAYVALPAAPVLIVQSLPQLGIPLDTLPSMLLLVALHLPVTVAFWLGMRAWTVHSLRRLRLPR